MFCVFLSISTSSNRLIPSFRPSTRVFLHKQDQVAGKLDPTAFPYVKDTPPLTPAPSLRATPSTGATSLRSAKPSWHRAARPGAGSEAKQRVIVFMAGGMAYSEMREAYAAGKSLGKEVIIGEFLELFGIRAPVFLCYRVLASSSLLTRAVASWASPAHAFHSLSLSFLLPRDPRPDSNPPLSHRLHTHIHAPRIHRRPQSPRALWRRLARLPQRPARAALRTASLPGVL